MLRRTSGLPQPIVRWASQVTASLGATLTATLIWSAVPHSGSAPAAGPATGPELTSGGKFAVRAVKPAAYDGLDTMPLPHVAPPPPRLALASAEVAPPRMLQRASWDEAPAIERRAVRPTRPQVRVEPRRPEPGRSAAPAAAMAASPAAAAPEPQPGRGFLDRVIPSSLPSVLPGIVSTAVEAWTATASAGDALVARVVPRMP